MSTIFCKSIVVSLATGNGFAMVSCKICGSTHSTTNKIASLIFYTVWPRYISSLKIMYLLWLYQYPSSPKANDLCWSHQYCTPVFHKLDKIGNAGIRGFLNQIFLQQQNVTPREDLTGDLCLGLCLQV